MRKLLALLLLLLLIAAAVAYCARPTTIAPAPREAAAHVPAEPAPLTCGSQCGTERWLVKTLADPDRSQVDLHPRPSSVAELAALPRPDELPEEGRAEGAERTTFVVQAYLGGWHPENDGDIHIILFDPDQQAVSMIAEIPDPECSGACSSGYAEAYAQARSVLQAIVARPNPEDKPVRVEVTGVGFFDRNHGQTGAAPNFIELHPVLKLRLVE